MNFFFDSISSIGGNTTSFTEKLFGRRDSIASIVAREALSEPQEITRKSREETLILQVAQLKKKLARATASTSFAGTESEEIPPGDEEVINFSTAPDDSTEMSNLLECLSTSTSLIAKTHSIASEKDSLDCHKLKSTSSIHILEFLSNIKLDSVQSAIKSVPPSLRTALAFEIGMDKSLEEAFGKDVGPNQPFLKALRLLVKAREDLDYTEVLSGLAMAKTSVFNRENIISMLAAVRLEISTNPAIFEGIPQVSIKESLVSNIQPSQFRTLVERHMSIIRDPSCSVSDVYAIIQKEIKNHNIHLRQQRLLGGVELLASAVKIVPEPGKTLKCWNCGGAHRIKECKKNCRIHDKPDCVNKFRCMREARTTSIVTTSDVVTPPVADPGKKKVRFAKTAQATKKRKTVVLEASSDEDEVSSSNNLIAKSAASISKSKFPRMKKTKDILLDSGANVLCLSKSNYFDKLDESSLSKSGSISVATGVPSVIHGSGSIGNHSAKYTPNFDHSLAPMSVITNNNVGIFIDDELVILPITPSLINNIGDIIKKSKNPILHVKRSNGVYPVDIDQLKKLCSSNDSIKSHAHCVLISQ